MTMKWLIVKEITMKTNQILMKKKRKRIESVIFIFFLIRKHRNNNSKNIIIIQNIVLHITFYCIPHFTLLV